MASEPGIPYEKRLDLALSAIQSSTISSIYKAAVLYNVSHTTLYRRLRGRATRRDGQTPNRKLTASEEQALIDRIIELDNHGYSPPLPYVRQMANRLLQQRLPGSVVGPNWLTRFLKRHKLIAKYLRKYDYQRAKCEDLEVINQWFEQIQATITQYGIAPEDIYNFDESGFQMGVISTAKVVTQRRSRTKRSGRPKVQQPGNRNWVTVIEGINATGWTLPSTIIFEGKVHQSSWYRTGIPSTWTIGLSENGWTTNELGYKWISEVFDKHTRHRIIGTYRLLLLDGHESHISDEFINFCRANSIIWRCFPPHSTHLLQALDFGCFSPLKGAYGRLVLEKAGLGVTHIDKEDFLVLYHQAHQMIFTEKLVKAAFMAVGIVPFDPQKVLSRLKPKTPSPQLQPATLDLGSSESHQPLRTPYDITELDAQVKALQRYRSKGSSAAQGSPTDQALHFLIKGCQMALHGATLLAEENKRLRTENQRQKRKRDTRRSYIARGGILSIEDGIQLIEARNSGSGGADAQPGRPKQRLCSICKSPGHDKRTCTQNADLTQDSIHVAI